MKESNARLLRNAKSRERKKRIEDIDNCRDGSQASKDMVSDRLVLLNKRKKMEKDNPNTRYSLSIEEIENIPDIAEINERNNNVKN